MITLVETFRAIDSEFSGKDNAGIRRMLRSSVKDVGQAVLDGFCCPSKPAQVVLACRGKVAFTALGAAKLESIARTFAAEVDCWD